MVWAGMAGTGSGIGRSRTIERSRELVAEAEMHLGLCVSGPRGLRSGNVRWKKGTGCLCAQPRSTKNQHKLGLLHLHLALKEKKIRMSSFVLEKVGNSTSNTDF